MAVVAALSLLADALTSGPITSYITETDAVVVGVAIFGRFQAHRTFTHSLLALLLLSVGVAMVCLPLTLAFAIGFLSHVLLDLLNKKRVQLLDPSKVGNICLGLCYASGVVNKGFLALGVLGSAVGLGYSMSSLT